MELSVTSAAYLEGVDAQEYETFVLESPSGHASQSIAWAEVARAGAHVAPQFIRVRSAGRLVGTALLLRPVVAGVGLPWAWIERGPVAARIDDVGKVTAAIAGSVLTRGILRLRVTPYWADEEARLAQEQLRGIGFRDAYRPDGAHACTIRIDVGGKTDADLFSGNSKAQVRRRIRQAEKAGAHSRPGTPDDWTRLYEMHRQLMELQGQTSRPLRWWRAIERFVARGGRGALFACEFGGRAVSAAVVIRHGRRATYAWAASVADKLPFAKAIPPLIAGIRWARDAGCTSFDLGGVPLEADRDPKRNAIAEFKFDFDKRRVFLVREHVVWCARAR